MGSSSKLRLLMPAIRCSSDSLRFGNAFMFELINVALMPFSLSADTHALMDIAAFDPSPPCALGDAKLISGLLGVN